jgi:virulence factor Mce-like protein
MRRTGAASLVANPVLVGAVTTLVIAVAVFLAYNANKGLPFVPTFEFRVETPDASRLVLGNDVREGGQRIGQVAEIRNVRLRDGNIGAQLKLRIEQAAAPLPADTQAIIRTRSALGSKYVELIRGRSSRELPTGAVLTAGAEALQPEIDDVFDMFTPEVRRAIQTNLETYGGALAGRGGDLNRSLAALPQLLGDLPEVMQTLSDPDTGLRTTIRALARTAGATAPVADDFARGFTGMADTFEALSRDPQALQDFIAESPPTLDQARRSFVIQRPFLREFAALSGDLRATAAELRRSAQPIGRALAVGARTLPQTPALSEDLQGTFAALRELTESPTTNLVLQGLGETVGHLDPMLRYLGPHVTVCNYWNYWWTFLSDNLSEEVASGTLQRVGAKTSPLQTNTLNEFGAGEPANGEGADPASVALFGDPANLHAQPYGRAVDEQGNADCESGQRGYPERLATGADPRFRVAVDPRTPGNQGPTFTGRARVPEGQTFSAEPTGSAPQVAGVTP